MFCEFIDAFEYEDDAKRQNLWVLAIINDIKKKKYSFTDLISENRIAEIMITNFEIHDFSDPKFSDTKFKVYEFSQLLKELMLNANADIEADWEEKWKEEWDKNDTLKEIKQRMKGQQP